MSTAWMLNVCMLHMLCMPTARDSLNACAATPTLASKSKTASDPALLRGHSMHFCVPNDTETTRVSIDFRAIPLPYYDETFTHLPSGHVSFKRGGYYRSSDDAEPELDEGGHTARGPQE